MAMTKAEAATHIEAQRLARRMSLIWPHSKTPPETFTEMWVPEFEKRNLTWAWEAIESLQMTDEFFPSFARFMETYRTIGLAHRRDDPPPDEIATGSLATPEQAAHWQEVIREQLRTAGGPLAGSLRASVDPANRIVEDR